MYKGFPTEYTTLFNILTSTKHYEDDYEMTMLGGAFPKKPEGESIQYVDPVTGTTKRYTHDTFGMGFRVTEEMYEDDLYNVIRKMPRGLAKAQKNTIELQAIGVLDDAFGAVGTYTAFDGHPLCYATHHVLFTGGTYANTPSTQADLSITTLQASVLRLEKTPDQDGVLAGCKANLLVIAPDSKFIAREILKSEYKPYTSGNEINALLDEELKYFVSHYLSDTDAWFLRAKEHDLNFFWRRKPRFDNSDDFDSGDAKYKGTHRSIQGFGEWRGWDGSSGG
jgi:hypothetical protein